MKLEEYDCGSWGWYFEDDEILRTRQMEFLQDFITISYKCGINLSTFAMIEGIPIGNDSKSIVGRIFEKVQDLDGNQLQKALSYNFYSEELSTRVLPSFVYSNDPLNSKVLNDTDSMLFSTLKEDRFHSFFYNLRSNIFFQEIDDYVYWNTARFNSYIRWLHHLMNEFNCKSFDLSSIDSLTHFSISNEGFILYKEDCIFYEDVYDLLPNDKKYSLFEKISPPNWYC